MPEDQVRGVAGFLADAARGAVSTRTVVQVLQHWVTEGVSYDDLHAAVDHVRESAGGGHGPDQEHWLARYEKAISSGLVLSSCCHKS